MMGDTAPRGDPDYWAREAERKRLAQIKARQATAVKMLHKDPVNHVQFGFFSTDDLAACSLILESRSSIDMHVPTDCAYLVANHQISYVEDTDGKFYLWFGKKKIQCYVDSIEIDARGMTKSEIDYLWRNK